MKWSDLKLGYKDRLKEAGTLSPHELLGTDANASQKDIKAAYLQLIKAYHPDLADPFMAKHNEEMTKLLNAAYEKLKMVDDA